MLTVKLIFLYLAAINLTGFFSMGIDKKRARKHEWRISEFTLFLFAILGGSIGSILGMHMFHHKTRHWYFKWGMPLILILQIAFVITVTHIPGLTISIM